MKVITVSGADARSPRLDLHPFVTVVTGLDIEQRAWLRSALGRLAAGGDAAATGTIEAHGIRFALDASALALLDLLTPVEAVVTSGDLPGHDPALEVAARGRDAARLARDEAAVAMTRCRATLTEAITERDDATRVLEELLRGEGPARDAIEAAAAERARLEDRLRAAREDLARAEGALGAAEAEHERANAETIARAARLEAARSTRQDAIARAATAAAALEEARSGLRSLDELDAALQQARTGLSEAESAAGAADPGGEDSPVTRRLADLERRRAELTRMQVALAAGPADAVDEALDGVLAGQHESGPLVDALALADTWRDLMQQIGALDAGVPVDERAAEERVARCRQALLEAEAGYNQPVLTPEQIAKVEAAHLATLEAQDKAEGRIGRARAKKRLEEVRQEEARVLERLGFSAYADYMMSASNRGSAPANRSLVDAARNLLEAAETELQGIPGAGDRARRRLELMQRRDATAPRIAELLGHEPEGPEAEDELRALRAPVEADPVALGRLADALTAVGIDPGGDPYEQDDLVLLARSYLAEERSAGARRQDVDQAIAALDAAIESLRAARGRGDVEVPESVPLPPLAEPVAGEADAAPAADEEAERLLREARWAEVEAARTHLADAQAAADQGRADHASLADLEADLAAATAAEASAAASLAALESEAAAFGPGDGDIGGAALGAARSEVDRCRTVESELVGALAAAQGASGAESLIDAARRRVADAESALTLAAADEQRAAAAQVGAEATLASAEAAVAEAEARAESVERADLLAEVDWVLLTRLAGVRSVGLAGSVPLVLDDPFSALAPDEVPGVLDRVARLAGAVQVVVLSDDPSVVGWARSAGADRAAVQAA